MRVALFLALGGWLAPGPAWAQRHLDADSPDGIVSELPFGSETRFTREELCEAAARTPDAEMFSWGTECEFEPLEAEGLAVMTFRFAGGQRMVLLEGRLGTERFVSNLHVCHAGPDGNSSCGIELLRVHETTFSDRTAISLETESDRVDYDATDGEEVWHRQLTVCTHDGTSASLVCTAQVPLGLRYELFHLPNAETEDASTAGHWTRAVLEELELTAIAVIRRDGRVRLRATRGSLDFLYGWWGDPRCASDGTDEELVPWAASLVTGPPAALRPEWSARRWPRAYPDYVDPARVEGVDAACSRE